MIGRTLRDKVTSLINKQILDSSEKISHKNFEILSVKNDLEKKLKTLTIRTNIEGKSDKPFDVEVDIFDHKKYLTDEIWLPYPINRNRIFEILTYDYVWDLKPEDIEGQIPDSITDATTLEINLDNTCKYAGKLTLHFVKDKTELPEDVLASLPTSMPDTTNVFPDNSSPSNFYDVANIWMKIFDTTIDSKIRCSRAVDIMVLSSYNATGKGAYVSHPAQRVLWAGFDKITVYISPYDAAKYTRDVTITLSDSTGNTSVPAQIRFKNQNTILNWYDGFPESWNAAVTIARNPILANDLQGSFELYIDVETKREKLRVAGSTDLKTLKSQSGDALFQWMDVSFGSNFNYLVNHDPSQGVFTSVKLENNIAIYSSWAIPMCARQINWGIGNFRWIGSLALAIGSSSNGTARTLRTLLNSFDRSPELVKVTSSACVRDNRFVRSVRISFPFVDGIEDKEYDIELSAPYSAPVCTFDEADIFNLPWSPIANGLLEGHLESAMKVKGADIGSVMAFTELYHGDIGFTLQLKEEFNPLILKTNRSEAMPYKGTVRYFDVEGVNECLVEKDEANKTVTYHIKGTDNKIVITNAVKHFA